MAGCTFCVDTPTRPLCEHVSTLHLRFIASTTSWITTSHSAGRHLFQLHVAPLCISSPHPQTHTYVTTRSPSSYFSLLALPVQLPSWVPHQCTALGATCSNYTWHLCVYRPPTPKHTPTYVTTHSPASHFSLPEQRAGPPPVHSAVRHLHQLQAHAHRRDPLAPV
jgi:hypothetical protein